MITLDDDHVYRIDGRIVPSVTQVIKGGARTYYTAGSAERGHRVHAATVMYDAGDTDVESYPEYLKGYVKAWAEFRKDSGFTPTLVECMGAGVEEEGHFAGTIDRIGVINGRWVTLDIKSGGAEKGHLLQLAGYWLLKGGEECSPWNGANDLALVYLKATGVYSYTKIMDSVRMNAVIQFKAKLREYGREA